ncbi:MAG: hypothetical protein ACHQ9S_08360 [Candidatus Binatia bacterium]
MAEESTDRNEPILAPGARSSRRHRPSGGLALLIVLGLYAASFAAPAGGASLISVGIKGVSGNGASSGVSLSADGSVVAFYSDATDLVPSDTNERRDVFVHDANATPSTERVSVSSAGGQANGNSQGPGMAPAPAISDDGQIVAFHSDATNLVAGDNNGATDVFVRNRQAGSTELVSVNLSGTSGNGASRFPSISADGRFVAFQSAASDLVSGDTNGAMDIFVRDRLSGTTERVCGVQPNADSSSPSISADGNFVAFVSAATNLVPTQTNGQKNVFVCDRTTGTAELISVSTAGVPGNSDSIVPAISGDGNIVAFKSEADNLVPHDNNGVVDVFARDRAAGTTERVSVSFAGGDANDGSFLPVVSRDGRFVAFGSSATNLVLHDFNNWPDVFIRDRQIGVTLLVDLTSDGSLANAGTPDVAPAISADGNHMGFVSFASNLAPNDNNGLADVFTTANPFVCANGGTCPSPLVCVAGFCTPPTPTPTAAATGTNTLPPTITPTPTSTPTPTPTIACFVDTDCPRGQVCDPTQKVCKPAPTPTPRTQCTTSGDCPPDQKCGPDGFCQLIVTPTPTITPTPLPTCTTDADCLEPGTQCRAGVCVPARPCTEADVSKCRGSREACVAGTCECGGDCDLDGLVLGNEITKMVCVLNGQCPLSDCAAGDFNGDGQITGSEVCTAITNLGLGCPAEGQALVTGQAASEARSLDISSASGAPGEIVTISVDLSGGGNVATAQMDLLLDSSVLEIPADAATACAIDPRINATDAVFMFLPQTPSTVPGMARMRLFVADLMLCRNNEPYPLTPFDQGALVSCQFRINPSAAIGATAMLTAERLNIGDPRGNEYTAAFTSGTVTVTPPKSCTADSDCPDGNHCRAGICKAIRPCSGPTAGPAECLGGREACIEESGAGVCECGGDCNLDGRIRADEITTLVNVFTGTSPLSLCPADDITGDGRVRADEITSITINFSQGCQ